MNKSDTPRFGQNWMMHQMRRMEQHELPGDVDLAATEENMVRMPLNEVSFRENDMRNSSGCPIDKKVPIEPTSSKIIKPKKVSKPA